MKKRIRFIIGIYAIITGIIFSIGSYELSHLLVYIIFGEVINNITLIMDIPLGFMVMLLTYQIGKDKIEQNEQRRKK